MSPEIDGLSRKKESSSLVAPGSLPLAKLLPHRPGTATRPLRGSRPVGKELPKEATDPQQCLHCSGSVVARRHVVRSAHAARYRAGVAQALDRGAGQAFLGPYRCFQPTPKKPGKPPQNDRSGSAPRSCERWPAKSSRLTLDPAAIPAAAPGERPEVPSGPIPRPESAKRRRKWRKRANCKRPIGTRSRLPQRSYSISTCCSARLRTARPMGRHGAHSPRPPVGLSGGRSDLMPCSGSRAQDDHQAAGYGRLRYHPIRRRPRVALRADRLAAGCDKLSHPCRPAPKSGVGASCGRNPEKVKRARLKCQEPRLNGAALGDSSALTAWWLRCSASVCTQKRTG